MLGRFSATEIYSQPNWKELNPAPAMTQSNLNPGRHCYLKNKGDITSQKSIHSQGDTGRVIWGPAEENYNSCHHHTYMGALD
jgi:hypothetical protein